MLMKNKATTVSTLTLAALLGNMMYQCATASPDFSVAIERTFFQFVAMAVYQFVTKEE